MLRKYKITTIWQINSTILECNVKNQRGADERITAIKIERYNLELVLVMAGNDERVFVGPEEGFQSLNMKDCFRVQDDVLCRYIVLNPAG